MKTYSKQIQRKSQAWEGSPKASRQASIDKVLQKYTGENRLVQRASIPEEEELIQGKFATTVQRQGLEDEEEVIQAKAAPNTTGLPDNLKTGIENLSGYSMDDVHVHYNSSKPAQMQALAYTQGSDIHVGSGQEKHLPHEAWHVVQQKQGRVQPTMQMKGVNVNDDKGLEREADVMGSKALYVKEIFNKEPRFTLVAPKTENLIQKEGTKTAKATNGTIKIGEEDYTSTEDVIKKIDKSVEYNQGWDLLIPLYLKDKSKFVSMTTFLEDFTKYEDFDFKKDSSQIGFDTAIFQTEGNTSCWFLSFLYGLYRSKWIKELFDDKIISLKKHHKYDVYQCETSYDNKPIAFYEEHKQELPVPFWQKIIERCIVEKIKTIEKEDREKLLWLKLDKEGNMKCNNFQKSLKPLSHNEYDDVAKKHDKPETEITQTQKYIEILNDWVGSLLKMINDNWKIDTIERGEPNDMINKIGNKYPECNYEESTNPKMNEERFAKDNIAIATVEKTNHAMGVNKAINGQGNWQLSIYNQSSNGVWDYIKKKGDPLKADTGIKTETMPENRQKKWIPEERTKTGTGTKTVTRTGTGTEMVTVTKTVTKMRTGTVTKTVTETGTGTETVTKTVTGTGMGMVTETKTVTKTGTGMGMVTVIKTVTETREKNDNISETVIKTVTETVKKKPKWTTNLNAITIYNLSRIKKESVS